MDKETTDYILNLLRRGTTTWSGRTQCLNRGRRKRKVGAKLLWERNCDGCGEWHLQKDNSLEVDHIDEVGPYKGDLHAYAERMYCGQDNLQALCFTCHSRKTSRYNSTLRFQRKNVTEEE
jgi:hypothetical protein